MSDLDAVRVIVADDADDLRTLVVRLLSRSGGIDVVAEAQDSSGVLAAVEQNDVDVLLLDLSMPGAGGLSVLRQLHLSHPELAIVILSGLPAHSAAESCLDAGAFRYIEKGTGIKTLASVILEAAGR